MHYMYDAGDKWLALYNLTTPGEDGAAATDQPKPSMVSSAFQLCLFVSLSYSAGGSSVELSHAPQVSTPLCRKMLRLGRTRRCPVRGKAETSTGLM